MKTFLYATLFATCFAVAICESCSHRDECTATNCNMGSIECVDFEGTHACICIVYNQHGIGCTTQSQCIAALNCSTSTHCVDGFCHCEGDAHNQGLDIGGHQPGGQQTDEHQHPDHHQQHHVDGQQHQPGQQHNPDHHQQPGGQYHADHHHHHHK